MTSPVGLVKKNLPMITVLAVIAAAVVLVLADRWRRGSLVLGWRSLSARPPVGVSRRIEWDCLRCEARSSIRRRWASWVR